jgi:hypothetical protein
MGRLRAALRLVPVSLSLEPFRLDRSDRDDSVGAGADHRHHFAVRQFLCVLLLELVVGQLSFIVLGHGVSSLNFRFAFSFTAPRPLQTLGTRMDTGKFW